jgi:hypothetical protein
MPEPEVPWHPLRLVRVIHTDDPSTVTRYGSVRIVVGTSTPPIVMSAKSSGRSWFMPLPM